MDKKRILSYLLILCGFAITIYCEWIKPITLENFEYFVYGFLASMFIGVGINLHDSSVSNKVKWKHKKK